MTRKNRRPVFLDLTRIHLPVTAVLSITHRLTGILFFLLIPLLIYLFDLSLSSREGYEQVAAMLNHWPVRFIVVLLVWGFAHHLLGGIRFLFIDIDMGVKRTAYRKTAWWAIAGGIAVLFISAMFLL